MSRHLLPLLLVLSISGAGCLEVDQAPVDHDTTELRLPSAAELAPLGAACPTTRTDELCDALRTAAGVNRDLARQMYEHAGELIAARVAVEPRAQVLADPAVRWWVRERSTALLAWNASPDSSDKFLAEFFPAYPPGSFPIADAGATPPVIDEQPCARPTEAVIVFVGILRSSNLREFDRQTAALESTFPCLRTARVEYTSFVPADENAALARELIAQIDAELGPVPLHFIGYSQGVTNALHTLANYPDIAARTRTFVSLNSAAHGSETADALLAALALSDTATATCNDLPAFARLACTAVDITDLTAIADFLRAGLSAFGDFDDADGSTAGELLRRRIAGLRSIGTAETARFWREHGAQLPTSTLYLSFRSFISDPARDLPMSNAWSYVLLKNVDPWQPANDMQVRLVNHALGGPLASVEVVGPAAEGNHWQWELTSDDLSEQLEPVGMAERMPHEAPLLAYYQTLHEIGLVLPAR